MRNLNADMDVLFALTGINNIENEFMVAMVLVIVCLAAAVCLTVWIRKYVRGNASGSLEDSQDEREDREYSSEDNYIDGDAVAIAIAGALGGTANIYSLRSSDTRLRVTVNNGALVDRRKLKATGALGILAKGRQVQVFYEDQVERICRELGRYIDGHRKDNIEQEAEIDYERVLKKVYVPVEGDVVRVSDIHCLQNLGDGSVGLCAIRATRGEIRAPFDCKAGYSKARAGQIECVSKEGYVVGIHLIADGQRDWNNVCQPVNIRLMCNEGERVRKGKLLAEYPYETFAGMGDKVYVVLEAYVSESSTSEGERSDEDMDRRYHLVINNGKRVDYEHVACEIVE